MHLLNLTLGQFLAVFGSVSALAVALYLLDRSRRRQVVATLRFWLAADQPPVITRRRHIQQPLSLLLQLLSIALLLLAAAQLRLGAAGAPRDHVLLLETSSWMSAAAGGRTLMDAARDRALAYIRSLPARDRLMIVRADALATPATVFEPDRGKLEEAVLASQPGSMALNLERALAFARGIQAQGGRRAGEIVFVGSGRVAHTESPQPAPAPPRNLRALMVPDPVENCGLRKMGLRRAASDPGLWDIYVGLRNYGAAPRAVSLTLTFGPSRGGGAAVAVGARRLVLQPGVDTEVAFEYRTLAAGLLEARLHPHDAFADDDHAVLELPAQPRLPVAVYSDQPDLLRPLLAANPRLQAAFHPTSAYRAATPAGLVILDRFRPSARPTADAIWIDPPADASPVPVRERLANVQFSRWNAGDPLAAGLRAKDFKLQAASVFEPAATDIRIGEVAAGPVIVARPGKPKAVVLGFHPTAMRYELAAPLLFANVLRWMQPEIFRRWELSAGSVGTVSMALDPGVGPSGVRVLHENGAPVPFTLRGNVLHFFAGTPGTVRVMTGDHEYVYSLTLPQLWETRWEPPENVRRGLPRQAAPGDGGIELWPWLALAGMCGLLVEWFLFGRFSRGRMARGLPFSIPARRRAPASRRPAGGRL